MPQQKAADKQNLDPSELQGEFVVGGGRGYYPSEILTNGGIDAFAPNFNSDIARRMRFDSEIESSGEFLIDAIFADGIAPVPRITDEESDDYAKAAEIAQFVKTAVETATRSLEAVYREKFRGAFFGGAKISEIVLKPDADGNLVLDRLNPKPNSSVAFVCDKFYNVLGFVGATSSAGVPSWLMFKATDVNAREKLAVLQLELEDNDPRGVKKILAVLDAWLDKRDTRPQYKEWRRTSAIPKKVGITAAGAREIEVRDANGQRVLKNGVPQTQTAERALMESLEGFANNSTVTAPNGTEVKQLEVLGTGAQFTNSLKFNNSEIRKGILGDSVSTGEDDKGVKSAKQVSMNVVDLRVKSYRNKVAESVERDIFRLITVVNFGEEFAHLTPRASLGDTERRDWATDLDAANGAGYMFASEHLPEIDVQFGLKPRAEQTTATVEPDNSNNDAELAAAGGDATTANQQQGDAAAK